MSKATEKQIEFIKRMIAEARTTDAKVAWARNGLDDHINNDKVRIYLRPEKLGVLAESAPAHLAIYDGALKAVEWMLEAVEAGDVELDSKTAYKIGDALKNPTLANISGIGYEYSKGPKGGAARNQMYFRQLTSTEKAEANYTAIHVHLPAEIANALVESKEGVGTELIETEVGT